MQNLSDIEDSTVLEEPMPLNPRSSLSEPTDLVVSLLDALDEAGWAGASRRVKQSSDSGQIFGNRHITSKRAYLPCVLRCNAVYGSGLSECKSNQSAAYYCVIMRQTGKSLQVC